MFPLVRVVKGVVADPHSRAPIEVVLVRPPLYLTVPEYEELAALAVAAGLAPPAWLDRGRKARVRTDVVAELCRRTILRVHCGVAKFPDARKVLGSTNYPMRAYARQKVVGARFPCRACAHRKQRRAWGERERVRQKKIEALEAENAQLRALIAEQRGQRKGRAA